jgi:hypothetical protein
MRDASGNPTPQGCDNSSTIFLFDRTVLDRLCLVKCSTTGISVHFKINSDYGSLCVINICLLPAAEKFVLDYTAWMLGCKIRISTKCQGQCVTVEE